MLEMAEKFEGIVGFANLICTFFSLNVRLSLRLELFSS